MFSYVGMGRGHFKPRADLPGRVDLPAAWFFLMAFMVGAVSLYISL